MGFISRGSQKWSFTWKSLIMVWLSFCIQLTAGQVSISPPVQDAAVGGKATLSVRATVSFVGFNWFRGTITTPPNIILTTRLGPPFNQTPGPQYTGREKVLPSGDLEITNLLTNYTGNYTVQIVLSDLTTQQATAQLRVYDPTETGSPTGLTPGAIAGIVIGFLVLCGIVGGLVYYFVFMNPATGPSNSVPMDSTATAQKNTEAPPNAKANGNVEEIQYSSVSFVPKVAPPAKPTNENTVYSEVRR